MVTRAAADDGGGAALLTGLGSGAAYLREYLSTGYGLRFSTEIYGSKREKTVFHEYLQEACFVLTEISEISGNLREFTGECNLGILYSTRNVGSTSIILLICLSTAVHYDY